LKKDKEAYNSGGDWKEKRQEAMGKNNPFFQLRNYMIQNAIEYAENRDYSGVRKMLDLCTNPFGKEECINEDEI